MRWKTFKNKLLSLFIAPSHEESSEQIQNALVYHNAGRLDEAKNIYEEVISKDSTNADALHLLGVLTYQLGQYKPALSLINKAIKLDSSVAAYFNNQGLVLQKLDLQIEAIKSFEHAFNIDSNDYHILNNLGNTSQKLGRSEEAINYYKHALSLNSSFADAYNNLGNVYQELEQYEDAIDCFERVIEIKPDNFDVYNVLGNVLQIESRFNDAVKCYQQALEINPNNPEVHNNFGNVYIEMGRQEEAIKCYLIAVELEPGYAVAHKNLGIAYQELGEKKKAISCYEQAIEVKPDFAEVYHYLTIVNTNDKHQSILEKLLSGSSSVDKDTMHYHYALGNIYQSINSYDKAFEHFQKANAINRETIKYNSLINTEYINRLIKTFSKQFFNDNSHSVSASDMPVFVIGMPRSGTSLVEQIISNHSMVHGGGEITALAKVETEIRKLYGDVELYPECIMHLDEGKFKGLSEQYIKEIERCSTGVSRVVDKLPGNFLRIGLIKILFPNARIIHCQRNALDTCVSIYTNYFAQGYKYGYDLEELGEYYCNYEKLMAHWDSLFSAEILNIKYEELVHNQEAVSRKLIKFLGLDWEEHCLDFHKNNRPVKTASNMQVRSPMYTHAVNRWQIYERQLQPLISILNTSHF